jgi:hypothetical protein
MLVFERLKYGYVKRLYKMRHVRRQYKRYNSMLLTELDELEGIVRSISVEDK